MAGWLIIDAVIVHGVLFEEVLQRDSTSSGNYRRFLMLLTGLSKERQLEMSKAGEKYFEEIVSISLTIVMSYAHVSHAVSFVFLLFLGLLFSTVGWAISASAAVDNLSGGWSFHRIKAHAIIRIEREYLSGYS